MKKKADKERMITELLDEYLIKRRAGERPALEEYTKRYPEYAADIRKAFAEEMDWMSNFHTFAEKIKIISPEGEKDAAWNKFFARIQEAEIEKRVAMPKRSIYAMYVATLGFAKSWWKRPAIKIFIPVTATLLLAMFYLLPPYLFSPVEYSDLAILEKAHYESLRFKGPVELKPAEKLFDEGMKFYEQDDYSDAMQRLRAYLELEPDNLYGHFYLGVCLLLEEKMEEGVNHLEISFELSRQQENKLFMAKSSWYLGNAYLRMGQGNKALKEFEKIIEFKGEYEEAAVKQIKRIEEVMKNSE